MPRTALRSEAGLRRVLPSFAAVLATALIAGLWLGPVVAPAKPGPGSSKPTSPPAKRSVAIGSFVSGADQNPAMIGEFSSAIGRRQAIVLSYKSFEQAPFFFDQLDGIWHYGAIPMITWEPWGTSLEGIAAGHDDAYIREAARTAAAWGKPLMIRFAQEMNGTWFPWGGRPGAYRAAWRHLVRLFDEAGADNVRWVWNPYANNGDLPFRRYFPGNRYVDWVGFDVINWGSGPFRWGSFESIAGDSYDQLRRLTRKPMILGEVGTGETGGNKARWLSRMLRRDVPRMPQVHAICFWSEDDPRGDLRLASSRAALRAVRRALARPLYRSSREAFLATPGWFRAGPDGSPPGLPRG